MKAIIEKQKQIKAIGKIIGNKLNAGNLELNGICINELSEQILSELSALEAEENDKQLHLTNEEIEAWLNCEFPLYKTPKNKREKECNIVQSLIRDGINYFNKALRENKIPHKS